MKKLIKCALAASILSSLLLGCGPREEHITQPDLNQGATKFLSELRAQPASARKDFAAKRKEDVQKYIFSNPDSTYVDQFNSIMASNEP